MAMFLLSIVPVALAQDTGVDHETVTDTDDTVDDTDTDHESDTETRIEEKDGETRVRIKSLTEEFRLRIRDREKGIEIRGESRVDGRDIARLRANVRARLAEKLQDHELRVKELRSEEHFKKFTRRAQKARDVAQVKYERARVKFKEATEEYDEAVRNYKNARPDASKLKDVLKECEKSETDECKAKVSKHKSAAKRFLLHTTDVIIAQLEKIESRINQNEDLTDEEASELLARLAEHADVIREARAAVEELTEDSTREEIKEAAQTVRDAWAKIKPDVKAKVEKVISSRIGGIIVRSKHLETKLYKTLDRMESKGFDTSRVEALVDEFNAHLDDAAEAYRQSQEALEGDNVREAHNLRKEADAALRKAHNVLKDIHKAIKSVGETVSDEPAEDESEVDDKEDESTDDTDDETESEEDDEDDEDEDDESKDDEKESDESEDDEE